MKTSHALALLVLLASLFAAPAFAANVQVSCTAVTTLANGAAIPTGTAVTYKFYGALQGKTKTLLNSTPATTCANTWVNAPAGTVCVDATAVIGTTNESAHSTEVCATVVAPAPSAPTGVTLTVIADTTAYKMRQSIDGIQMVAIGSVAAGTQCGAHNVDGYSLIPRARVTLASKFDTLPLTVFAQCS
jgi:hypothetical protein